MARKVARKRGGSSRKARPRRRRGVWRRRGLVLLGAALGAAGAWWILDVPVLWVESMSVPVQSVRLSEPDAEVATAGVADVSVATQRTAAEAAGPAVQVAATARRDGADRLATELAQEGYASYVQEQGDAGARLRYKVRVRPAADETAEQVAARLRRAGRSAWVVPR